MDLKKIETAFKYVLKEEDLKLDSVKLFKRQGEMVLDVAIDASLDLDKIALLSDRLSEVLDGLDEGEDAYLLDVHTVGLEKVLKTREAIKKAIGSYVFIKTKDKEEYYGDLLAADDEMITLAYKDKALSKKLTMPYENIKFIRLAVKF